MTHEHKIAYYNRTKAVGLMPSAITLSRFLELCNDE